MTAQSFQGFDFTPEEEPVNQFQGFDFTPEPELTKVEGVGRQVIKGAKELGSGLLGLPGDVMNLFDMVATGIEGAALEGALFLGEKAGLSPETSEQIRSKRQEVEDFKAQQFKLPGTEQLQQASDVGIQDLAAKLGYDLDVSPQDATERVSRRGLEFLSTAPVFGAGKIASVGAGVGSQIAEELGFGAVGQVGGALAGGGLAGLGRGAIKGATQVAKSPTEALAKGIGKFVTPEQINKELIKQAKQQGVELPAIAKINNNAIKYLYTKSLQSGLTGDALERQIAGTTEKIIENIKKVPKALGGRVRESREILGQEIQEVSQEFVKQRRKDIGALYDTAREGAEGLTVNGDNVFKVIQRTKKDLERTLVQGTEKKQTIATLDAALKNIHTEREVARSLGKQNIQDIKGLIGETFGKTPTLSVKSKNALNRIEKALSVENPKSADISKALDLSIKDLGRKFAPVGESAIASRLSEIKKDLTVSRRIPGKEVKIPVNTVIETMKDINDIVKFENFGGTNKLLLRLKGELDQTLIPFKKDNLFGNALERANKEFGELAQVFESDKKLANLLKNPEAKGLVKLAESPEGLERLLKTLPPEGSLIEVAQGVGQVPIDLSKRSQGIVRDLKRTLVEDAILKPMMDKRGNIDIRRASNVLSNKDSARLIKNIVGNKQFAKLKQSQKLAQSAADAMEKYMNFSQSGVTLLDAGAIGAVGGSAATSVATMNPLPLIVATSPVVGMRMFTNIMADPKMVDLIIEMGKVSKISKGERFIKAMAPLHKEYLQKLGEIAEKSGASPKDLGIEEEE